MIQITYFVHSTSRYNERKIVAGWYNSKLSKIGKQQARKLRKVLNVKRFDAVYCSDLKRAIRTAKLMFSSNHNIIKDKRLREIDFGSLTGLKVEDIRKRQIEHIEKRFPSGECYKDVEVRMTEFLENLSEVYRDSSVAIIAHQAPQLALEVLLNNKTWVQAFKEDWRIQGKWQPGWEYVLED